MKVLALAVTLGCILVPMLIATSPAQASRRIVFDPNSGYCKSGAHVRNVRNCAENGGRR
jgi:hypothetical protein